MAAAATGGGGARRNSMSSVDTVGEAYPVNISLFNRYAKVDSKELVKGLKTIFKQTLVEGTLSDENKITVTTYLTKLIEKIELDPFYEDDRTKKPTILSDFPISKYSVYTVILYYMELSGFSETLMNRVKLKIQKLVDYQNIRKIRALKRSEQQDVEYIESELGKLGEISYTKKYNTTSTVESIIDLQKFSGAIGTLQFNINGGYPPFVGSFVENLKHLLTIITAETDSTKLLHLIGIVYALSVKIFVDDNTLTKEAGKMGGGGRGKKLTRGRRRQGRSRQVTRRLR